MCIFLSPLRTFFALANDELIIEDCSFFLFHEPRDPLTEIAVNDLSMRNECGMGNTMMFICMLTPCFIDSLLPIHRAVYFQLCTDHAGMHM